MRASSDIFICKVPTHVYNFVVAGRIWTGRPVPEIAYCTFAPVDPACDEVQVLEQAMCYCRPKPTPTPKAPVRKVTRFMSTPRAATASRKPRSRMA